MLVAYVADKNAGGAVVVVSTSSHCSRCSACIALSLRLSSLYSCFCCSFSVSKALLLDAYTAAEYCDERVCKSVCVCLSLCLSVRDHVLETTRPIFTNFLCMLPMAVARSSSGGVVIKYVFPVLLMTSYLHIS